MQIEQLIIAGGFVFHLKPFGSLIYTAFRQQPRAPERIQLDHSGTAAPKTGGGYTGGVAADG